MDNLMKHLKEAYKQMESGFEFEPFESFETKYNKLQKELRKIEIELGERLGKTIFLSDENVDAENVLDGGEVTYGTEEFWKQMIRAAEVAAGERADEMGLDINKLIGRAIY